MLNGDVEYIYFTVGDPYMHVIIDDDHDTAAGGGGRADALELYLAGAAARLP